MLIVQLAGTRGQRMVVDPMEWEFFDDGT